MNFNYVINEYLNYFFVIGDMLVYKSTIKFVASFNITKKKKANSTHIP